MGAISELTEAIKLNRNDAAAYYLRGKAYRDKHRDTMDTSHYDEAIRDITNAIKLSPQRLPVSRSCFEMSMVFGTGSDGMGRWPRFMGCGKCMKRRR